MIVLLGSLVFICSLRHISLVLLMSCVCNYHVVFRLFFFFFQAKAGIGVGTGVKPCAFPISNWKRCGLLREAASRGRRARYHGSPMSEAIRSEERRALSECR